MEHTGRAPAAATGAGRPADVLRSWLVAGEWELPILPETGAAVLAACRDERSGARQVARLLERDPTLSARVLSVANSAAYAVHEPIVSLTQAIGRMGVTAVSEIMVAAVVRSGAFLPDRHLELIADVWPHSAVAAAWGREIARLQRRNVEGAFLCGLLHDVGRPIVLQGLIDHERTCRTTLDEGALREALDELHAEVGGRLVRCWSLPDWMADAVTLHHEPALAVEHRAEVMTTALACRLAHWSLEGRGETPGDLGRLPMLAELGIYAEEIDALLSLHPRVLESAGRLS
jgi:putative nucleotidyltransferase with HDIG domain